MKQQQQGALLTNIADNNNFYVSEKILDKIVHKIQETNRLVYEKINNTRNSDIDELNRLDFTLKRNQVSDEEKELIKRVLERRKKCYLENIHYWVMQPQQQQQQQQQTYKVVPTSCYWCSKKITEYH